MLPFDKLRKLTERKRRRPRLRATLIDTPRGVDLQNYILSEGTAMRGGVICSVRTGHLAQDEILEGPVEDLTDVVYYI